MKDEEITHTIYQERVERPILDYKEETMGFSDYSQNVHIDVAAGTDPSMHQQSYQDATLNNFFARPFPIFTTEWAVGTNLSVDLNPWNLYFSLPSVARKLDNYHMMRANLNIKVVINGTPFHYSRLMVSYHPLPGYNTSAGKLPLVGHLFERNVNIMRLSHLPHLILDPSKQIPGEMTLPFIYPQNYVRVSEVDDTVNSTSHLWKVLGTLHLQSTEILDVVSATAASDITVTVFAWASDVELAIPTRDLVSSSSHSTSKHSMPKSLNPTNTKKSGKGLDQITIPKDEKKDGLISSVSTVAASAAGALKDVPFIGSYANTAESVLNGVSGIARLFGLSRPPIFTDTITVQQRPISNIAYTDGAETVQKLTFDPKQALTMEADASGIKAPDELAIKMFTDRESLMNTILWQSADATDDILWWAQVTPGYGIMYGPGMQLTSLAYASYPFKYWSGSIKYRFQFVCSQYHTGRVRLNFEPYGSLSFPDNYNTTYSQVVDLSNTTDVTFIVPWAQTQAYRDVPHDFNNPYNYLPGTGYIYKPLEANGTLWMTVLNKLVSPDALKGIHINVYVSAGDDFELSVPSSEVEGLSLLASSDQGISSLSANHSTLLFGQTLSEDEVNDKQSVYFGEVVKSFRPLMKRYQYASSRFINITDSNINATTLIDFYVARTPSTFGYRGPPTSNSVSSTMVEATYNAGATQMFNTGPTPLMSYLAMSFLGHRGAVRWKYMTGGYSDVGIKQSLVMRDAEIPATIADYTSKSNYAMTDPIGFKSWILAQNHPTAWCGAMAQVYSEGLRAIEVEYPYYSPYRFSPNTYFGIIAPTSLDPPSSEVKRITYSGRLYVPSAHDYELISYVATGEDFTFFFYLGPPLFMTVDIGEVAILN